VIRAVAFDLDNTLIDFMTFKRETARAAVEAMVEEGLDGTPQKVAEEIFEIYDEYGIEYQKTFSTLLWNKHKIRDQNTFERIQQAGITAYLKKKFEVLKPYPDVKPTLKKLKGRGLKLCIVTNAPRNKAWQRMVIAGLQNEFDVVVTHDDTGKYKPDPLPFRTLLKRIRLKPSSVLFVGDDPGRDIKGAKAAGMKTALAVYGRILNRDTKIEPDFHIKNFKELLDIPQHHEVK
jgi:putative hydrolase of the HAD superfamily